MIRPFHPHDADAQRHATETTHRFANDIAKSVQALAADQDGTARRAKGECAPCFYLRSRRLGGAAMTTWHCGLCATPDTAGSTATPKLCAGCAQTHRLCTWCGGDQETRTSRAEWPTPVATALNDPASP
jgi:hypothetical protein